MNRESLYLGHLCKYIYILFLSVFCVMSSGCNFLDLFKSNKKQVMRQIDKMKASVNSAQWNVIETMMTDDFTWTTNENTTYTKTRMLGRTVNLGKKYFQASIDDLPKNRVAYYTSVDEIKKISKTRYFVVVNSRMKIRVGTSGTENINWTSQHTWVLQDGKWLVSSIKDITDKKGNGGTIFESNPTVQPKSKKRRPRKK